MSDNVLIKAQDNILSLLMEGSKGRNDFWNDVRFKKHQTDERGIYPRKILHIMKDAGLLEKFQLKKRVHWRIVDGAFFRMDGKEYNWSYTDPKIKPNMYVEVGMVGDEIREVSVVDKPSNPACVIQEIENDDYLIKATEALKKKPKNWLKKLKLW